MNKHYNVILRELREDHDLKQKDVAKVLNISQQQYARYEKGINVMPVTYLIKLCQFYNISADYILGLTSKIETIRTENKKEGGKDSGRPGRVYEAGNLETGRFQTGYPW